MVTISVDEVSSSGCSCNFKFVSLQVDEQGSRQAMKISAAELVALPRGGSGNNKLPLIVVDGDVDGMIFIVSGDDDKQTGTSSPKARLGPLVCCFCCCCFTKQLSVNTFG